MNEFHARRNEVSWADIVWHKKFISIHVVILWLAMKQKLSMKDKLHRIGIINSATCVLCGSHDEDINCLFFQCNFSSYIWKEILERFELDYGGQPWMRYIEINAREWKRNKLKHVMGKLRLGATTYII